MFTLPLRKPIHIGFLCLFLLMTTAFVLLLRVSVVNSANADDPPIEFVLQTPADNVFRLSMKTNDIIYNQQDQMIYASRPSSIGEDGNSITRINPLTGEIAAPVYVGSEPGKLALADDGHTMYISLDGAYAIRRYDTSTQTPGMQFAVGRENPYQNQLGSPYQASDIAVAPGNPNLVAVARYRPGISPPGAGVAVYDNGVRRPNTGPGHSAGANFLTFSDSASTLYGGGYYEGLRTMTVDVNGVTDNTGNGTPYNVRDLIFENNLIFTSNGNVIDPQTRTLLGTFPNVNTTAFVPVTESGRVLFAVRESSSPHIMIKAFDINTYAQIDVLTIPNVYSEARTLVRYGTNGIAMRTWDDQLYFIQTSLIPTDDPLPTSTEVPLPTPTPTPTVHSKFVRRIALPNEDMIYNRTEQKFYVSVPDTPGNPYSNKLVKIDPTDGAVENSVAVGTDPGRLALSDDEQTLYIGINGDNAVRKLDMATQTPGLQFPLGEGNNGPRTAHDIALMPDNPDTVAISYGTSSYSYDGADIYDNGVKRPERSNVSGSLTFNSPEKLYVGENFLYRFSVNPNGLSLLNQIITTGYGKKPVLTDGVLYTANGVALDPDNGEFKGVFSGLGSHTIVTVDVPENRIYFLTDESFGGWMIKAYRLDTFTPVSSLSLQGLPIYNHIRRLYRWGDNGFAIQSGLDEIFFIQTDLVTDEGIVPTGTQLSAQTYSSNESNGNLEVTVLRSGDLSKATAVDYATADGTATAGSDYTETDGTLTFAPGETSKTIDIPITNDNVYELPETFGLTLSSPSGPGIVEILSPGAASLTINDNDNLPNLAAANTSVGEPRINGTATIYFTVQLTNPTVQTATVNYATANGTATAGSDYTAASGTLTFAPLETSKTVAVTVLPDTEFEEPDETFTINFSNALNVSTNNSQGTATIVNFNPQTESSAVIDFDGDDKTDFSIFRPAPGEWWYLRSSDGGNNAFQFGMSSDTLVPADYTGDGKTDIAFWRESTGEWFVLRSEDASFYSFPFGSAGDIPAPGDFDGDGQADAAVYRPSTGTWFVLNSSGGTTITPFGIAEDKPVVGDYDGDGMDDLAIFRPSNAQWWINRSTDGVVVYQFGASGDRTVQGDYTGDGKTDVAFFRPSTGEWFVIRSEDDSFYSFPFGIDGDIPSPGDYDGDGEWDVAVFRTSNTTWYVNGSTSGVQIVGFGLAGDTPVPAVYSVP
jgi:hypothetical protein